MFYRGIIEADNSPTKDGRVKVRVFGVHELDKNKVPTDSLPWAEVMQGIDFIGDGKGKNTVPKVGTWVFVFFDHDNKNMPVVIGSIAAHNDINSKSSPDNRVIETPGGHLVEIDDDGNKIHIKHSSGSFQTMNADGSIVVSCTNFTVNASTKFTVNSPASEFSALVNSLGHLSALSYSGLNGSTLSTNVNIQTSQDVITGSISVNSHHHSGVQPGGGNTGLPY